MRRRRPLHRVALAEIARKSAATQRESCLDRKSPGPCKVDLAARTERCLHKDLRKLEMPLMEGCKPAVGVLRPHAGEVCPDPLIARPGRRAGSVGLIGLAIFVADAEPLVTAFVHRRPGVEVRGTDRCRIGASAAIDDIDGNIGTGGRLADLHPDRNVSASTRVLAA